MSVGLGWRRLLGFTLVLAAVLAAYGVISGAQWVHLAEQLLGSSVGALVGAKS